MGQLQHAFVVSGSALCLWRNKDKGGGAITSEEKVYRLVAGVIKVPNKGYGRREIVDMKKAKELVRYRGMFQKVQDLSKSEKSIIRGPGSQRESPKAKGIAGHIECYTGRRREARFANSHKHTSTFTHF